MAAPTLTFTGQRAYDAVEPLARGIYPQVSQTKTAEAVLDYPLMKFVHSLAAMGDEVAELTRDREDGTRGWAVLFDPYACPEKLLPWLAQWEGVEIPPGIEADELRALIDEAPAQKRGTPWAGVAFIQRYLTGTRRVMYQERYGGNPGVIGIRTLTSETPDPSTLLEAFVKYHKPGGIVVDYAAVATQSWATLVINHSPWSAVTATYPTWAAALNF